MTIDIDAIRRRVNRSTGGIWTLRERRSLDRRVLAVVSEGKGEMTYADIAEVPLEPGDDINDWRNDAEFIAHARTDIPALLAEVDRLQQQAEIRERSLRAVNTGLAAQRADLADKLHKANADNASLTKAGIAYANEVAGLKHELSQADRVIASLRAEIDEYDAAGVAR